jgi:hypothetical protein
MSDNQSVHLFEFTTFSLESVFINVEAMYEKLADKIVNHTIYVKANGYTVLYELT